MSFKSIVFSILILCSLCYSVFADELLAISYVRDTSATAFLKDTYTLKLAITGDDSMNGAFKVTLGGAKYASVKCTMGTNVIYTENNLAADFFELASAGYDADSAPIVCDLVPGGGGFDAFVSTVTMSEGGSDLASATVNVNGAVAGVEFGFVMSEGPTTYTISATSDIARIVSFSVDFAGANFEGMTCEGYDGITFSDEVLAAITTSPVSSFSAICKPDVPAAENPAKDVTGTYTIGRATGPIASSVPATYGIYDISVSYTLDTSSSDEYNVIKVEFGLQANPSQEMYAIVLLPANIVTGVLDCPDATINTEGTKLTFAFPSAITTSIYTSNCFLSTYTGGLYQPITAQFVNKAKNAAVFTKTVIPSSAVPYTEVALQSFSFDRSSLLSPAEVNTLISLFNDAVSTATAVPFSAGKLVSNKIAQVTVTQTLALTAGSNVVLVQLGAPGITANQLNSVASYATSLQSAIVASSLKGPVTVNESVDSTTLDSCYNGVVDGDETAVDCGGYICSTCNVGQSCSRNSDCYTLKCVKGVCSNSANMQSLMMVVMVVIALVGYMW